MRRSGKFYCNGHNWLAHQLKSTRPKAQVVTVDNGHFPYISKPEFYTQQLEEFWGSR